MPISLSAFTGLAAFGLQILAVWDKPLARPQPRYFKIVGKSGTAEAKTATTMTQAPSKSIRSFGEEAFHPPDSRSDATQSALRLSR